MMKIHFLSAVMLVVCMKHIQAQGISGLFNPATLTSQLQQFFPVQSVLGGLSPSNLFTGAGLSGLTQPLSQLLNTNAGAGTFQQALSSLSGPFNGLGASPLAPFQASLNQVTSQIQNLDPTGLFTSVSSLLPTGSANKAVAVPLSASKLKREANALQLLTDPSVFVPLVALVSAYQNALLNFNDKNSAQQTLTAPIAPAAGAPVAPSQHRTRLLNALKPKSSERQTAELEETIISNVAASAQPVHHDEMTVVSDSVANVQTQEKK